MRGPTNCKLRDLRRLAKVANEMGNEIVFEPRGGDVVRILPKRKDVDGAPEPVEPEKPLVF
jgi:hypothetical protein